MDLMEEVEQEGTRPEKELVAILTKATDQRRARKLLHLFQEWGKIVNGRRASYPKWRAFKSIVESVAGTSFSESWWSTAAEAVEGIDFGVNADAE